MKKLSYGLLLSLLFILNIGIVKAADDCPFVTGKQSESKEQLLVISVEGHDDLDWFETTYTMSDGSTYYGAFCQNAGLNHDMNGSSTFSILGSCNNLTTATYNEAIYAGVMKMLDQYDGGNYYQTLIAIRIYVYYLSEANHISRNNVTALRWDYAAWNLSYAYLAQNLASNDSEIRKDLQDLTEAGVTVTTTPYANYKTNDVSITGVSFISQSYYSQALSILKSGLEEAVRVAQEDSTSTSVSVSWEANDVDTSTSNKAVVSYTITYSGYNSLNEDDQTLKIDFDAGISESSDITVKLYLKTPNGDEYTNGTNVFEDSRIDANVEEGTFNFYAVYEYSDSISCSDEIEYTLELTYPKGDSKNEYDFELYELTACDSTKTCQYFYVMYDIDNAGGSSSNDDDEELTTEEITDSFYPCDDCDNLYQQCQTDGEGSVACDDYEQECNKGVECTTYLSNVTCSASEEELTIIEGVEGSVDSCEITQDLNVRQCVIDGEDLAGNSYEATDYISDSNRFCSVYCAEEYHITLPGQQAVDAGRYFTLSASVEGYRRCYTSEIDSEGTFTDFEEEARQKIYDAYDKWSMYKALSNLTVPDTGNDTFTTVPGTYKCTTDWSREFWGLWQDEYGLYYLYYYTINGNLYTLAKYYYGTSTYQFDDDSYYMNGLYVCNDDGYTTSLEYPVYRIDKANIQYLNHEGDYVIINDSDSLAVEENVINNYFGYSDITCNDYGCRLYDQETPSASYEQHWRTSYKNSMQAAADELNTAISNYMTLINEYNSCSGASVKMYNDTSTTTKNNLNSQTESKGWEMDYEFSPAVTFWYQETYMNSARTDELDTDGNVYTDNMVQTYYTEDVDDSYEGNGTTSTSIRTNNYSKLTNTLCYSTTSGFACGSGITIYVSQAKYVKQVIRASGDYITPTQFYTIYSTGTIVAENDESTTSEDIANSEALDNGLPVALNHKGYYAYTIQVSGIGMYNNDSTRDPGRVWGDDGSIVETASTKYSVCYGDFALESEYNTGSTTLTDGVYVCVYAVSCTPDDCPDGTTGGGPDDPPTCTPPDCPDIITNSIYRPVTTSNINPNDRVLGSNWNYAGTSSSTSSASSTTPDINSITSVSTALQLKAYVTTLKIYNEGESVYDLDENNVNLGGEGNGGKYVLTVTMDSEMTSWIKKYNEAAGDYVLGADVSDWTSTGESTLSCYDYYAVDGFLYENIFCYSSFLDDLFAKFDTNDGNDRIAGTNSRPTVDQRTNSTSYVGTDTNSYWTTFDSYLSDSSGYWTNVITSYEVSSYTSYNSEIGIGPSWK